MDRLPLEQLRMLVALATCSWDRGVRERTWTVIEQLLDANEAEELGSALQASLEDFAA